MSRHRSDTAATVISGAVIETAPLIAARFSARYLNVTRASKTLAQLAGAKRSIRRGRGVEFDEVRQYAAGDDVRSIDWRVTARSGEPHTKLFHEERERPVLVVTDLRASMKFGSVRCFKSVLAAHVASLILWSALDRGERVGGIISAGQGAEDFKPARSRHTVLSMLGEMQRVGTPEAAPGPEMSFAGVLGQLQRIARPGSAIFFISDFMDGLEPAALDELRRLSKRVQMTAIGISDPLESQLPAPGRYIVADAQGRSALDTSDPKSRARFSQQYEDSVAERKSIYQSLRIPIIPLSTADDPLPQLQRFFPGR